MIVTSGLSYAQLTRGAVSGVILDSTGAIVRDARVRITSEITNEDRETVTNEVGIYRVVGIEPGIYRVEFSAQGFETKEIHAVRVGPSQEVVMDEILTIRGLTESVVVRESLIVNDFDRATPSVGRNLERSYFEAVPLTAASRDLTRLVLLAPTVARAPGSTEFSANGQRARQNNFLIDGTDNNDLTVTVASAKLIPEGVGEFQVRIMPYFAGYGRNTGAQVLGVTRRGTNSLHGEVWDYYRANWMEPVSLLNKRAGLSATPRFVQNQPGVNLGGPIRQDHTFFFGLLEANRRRDVKDARNGQAAVIPTPAGYATLFTVPLDPGQTLESRQAVLSALDFLPEVFKEVRRYDNLQTQTIKGIPIEMGTVQIPLSNPSNAWYTLLRLDHRLTERDNLSYRYMLDKRFRANIASNLQFGSRFSAASEYTVQNHALSLTRGFTPNLFNEFRFAYSRTNQAFLENDPQSPTVQISGAFTIGGTSSFPQGRVANTFQWQDVGTYLMGRHSLKFGLDIRRNRLFDLAAFHSKGTWTFSSLSDFLLNKASSLRQVVSDSSFDARQTNQFYFFHDDFKVNKELTLNLGLRYEYSGVPFGFFGAANQEIAAAGVPLPARPDRNNWAPRFGFAYSPSSPGGKRESLLGDQQTVFRGGFGMAYDILFYNILTVTANNYPRAIRFDVFQPQTINLFPTLAPKANAIPSFNPLASFANVPTDIENPTTTFWSFSIQRHLWTNYLFEIGYSGNRSYHLLRQGERNPALLTTDQAQAVLSGGTIPGVQQRRVNPNWGLRATIESTALGEYHALFVRFDRSLSRDLLVGGNYTWSANLSDADEALGIRDIVLSTPPVPQDYFNYRNEWSRSAFDVPHRIVFHYLYEIFPPTLQGPGEALWKRILGGWQISGFSEWQSGQPFTVRTGVDSGGSGVPGSVAAWRPNLNPSGVFSKDPVENNLRTFSTPIDGTGVFVTPLTQDGLPLANSMPTGGNVGRNTFRGPRYVNWNFSLAKKLPVTERLALQLRADWYNLWNHRNFGNPVAVMSSPAFGTNTTDPEGRTMLIALKLLF
jgi:hypothetical protein